MKMHENGIRVIDDLDRSRDIIAVMDYSVIEDPNTHRKWVSSASILTVSFGSNVWVPIALPATRIYFIEGADYEFEVDGAGYAFFGNALSHAILGHEA
jgi:hypothetical protein